MANNFDLSALALQMACPGNVQILDDKGLPGAYVPRQAMQLNALLTNGDSSVHPAFLYNGVQKDTLYIGKYQACDGLVGIGPVEGNVHSGMASLQSLHGNLQALVSGGSVVFAVFERGRYVESSGASDAKFTFLLGIQVHQDISLQYSGIQAIGTCHSGFFIVGYKDLDGTMLNGRILQHCKAHSHANAVIGPKGGAVCGYPFSVNVCVDGVFQEIVGGVSGFLGNHIHMSLEDDTLAVFHSGGGGNADDYVAGAILDGVKAVGYTPVIQVFDYFALVL